MSDYHQRVYDAYNQWIDEGHEIVFDRPYFSCPSRVIYELDPIAYAEGLENWLDWLHHTMRSFCYECERFDVCHCGEDFDEDGVRICTPETHCIGCGAEYPEPCIYPCGLIAKED